MIRLFVGFDPLEAIAYHVFCHSVITKCSEPLSIMPLSLPLMRGVYKESHTDGSNEFIYSRFLVPHLCGYEGFAIFADGDMLCRDDLAALMALADPTKAVQVVKHDYKTKQPVKYLGAKNEDYPCKNWSSVIIWNCGHPANRVLTPQMVADASGAYLHRFQWLHHSEVGSLPNCWNWLVGEYGNSRMASILHYTLGTPCFDGYDYGVEADEWYAELLRLRFVPYSARRYDGI